jgi:serine/threonine-protein kinase
MATSGEAGGGGASAPTSREAKTVTSGDLTLALADLHWGHVVGRYVLLEELGRGGMGVVWSAYDPVLDRRIALKLVGLADRSEPSLGRVQAHVVREAQSLARLNHPNVVHVHDAGSLGETAFVAMEYVAGGTLRAWLERPRRANEVLAVFVAAGRGLEAAHAAGLVHRDFKPSNVLIGDDGRVRVSDFGLARPAGDDGAVAAASSLTGTPAYMAPEQLDGRAADARSDQYAYCLTMFEAFYGHHPFLAKGENAIPEALLARMRKGERAALAPPRIAPPRGLAAVLGRGLALAPTDRFPSMSALLAALAPVVHPRRPGRILLGVALLAVAALGAVALRGGAEAKDPCASVDEVIGTVWNPARAARIGPVVAATKAPQAEATWLRTSDVLDRYARRWRRAKLEICRVAGGPRPSDGAHDVRETCLAQRLAGADALLAVLEKPDAELVPFMVRAALALEPPEHCQTVTVDDQAPVPPIDASAQAEIGAIRALTGQARALMLLGKSKDARFIAEEAVRRAERLGYPPVLASAHAYLGRILGRLDDRAGALVELHAAIQAADRAFDDDLRYLSWLGIIVIELAREDEAAARLALAHARAAASRLPQSDERRAVLLSAEAEIDSIVGGVDRCIEHAGASLALRERIADDDRDEAIVLSILASCTLRGPHPEAAFSLLERQLEINTRLYGRRHPDVAMALANLGLAEKQFDRYAAAEKHYLEALDIRLEFLGPRHSQIAFSQQNLANLYVAMKRFDDAGSRAQAAAALWRELVGPDSPKLASAISIAGHARLEAGDGAGAESFYRQALEIRRRREHDGPDDVVSSLDDLGRALTVTKRAREALPLFEDAARRCAAIDRGDVARVKSICAQAHFGFARALVEADGDRARAVALAKEAYRRLDRSDESAERAEVATWLLAQGATAPALASP